MKIHGRSWAATCLPIINRAADFLCVCACVCVKKEIKCGFFFLSRKCFLSSYRWLNYKGHQLSTTLQSLVAKEMIESCKSKDPGLSLQIVNAGSHLLELMFYGLLGKLTVKP